MKLVFNHNNNGQAEIKATLGFLDGNFTYANLETDIQLNTPYLIDLISEEVYNKIQDHYESEGSDTTLNTALKYVQIYILSMAYLDYAGNNDLTHSNSGRSYRNEENEKLPWQWQLDKDEANIAKRAYKALDLLFILLEKEEWTEWTNSDAYKKANALFLNTTKKFDDAFPINKSGQLYYRLVPFMEDFEQDEIRSILTPDGVADLKAEENPSTDQKTLLNLIYKAVAYLSLGKAMQAFPVEMFPDGLMYREKEVDMSMSRAEVMQFLNAEGKNYLIKLEHEYQRQNQTFETINPTNGLEKGKKYVNL